MGGVRQRQPVRIGNCDVGDGHPVCITAELGVNHLGDFTRAKEMVQAAHEAGADLIKFQTYIAEKRYDTQNNPKAHQFIEWVAQWQFDRDVEAQLWEYAADLGATVFTSPFDIESLDFAHSLGSVAYKIAAFELVNHQLLRAVAAKGRPVVFSRGMATKQEIDDAIAIFESAGAPYIILHTISSYPLQKRDSHLRMIHWLREQYDCPVGHSDHTPGTDIAPLAVAAGANMIEKHFTVTPKRRESDNFFSITPDELEELIFRVRQVERYMGRDDIDRIETEDYMWDFRRKTE
ncbi:MAG: N-acetylneuraminate synthase family protein [Myxococcota bacterium]|nr:N-acetylneuraminate synthase family protein [Myxococcota bacterium]